jgi:RimJ/RimL family protein N-acetyltransferase
MASAGAAAYAIRGADEAMASTATQIAAIVAGPAGERGGTIEIQARRSQRRAPRCPDACPKCGIGRMTGVNGSRIAAIERAAADAWPAPICEPLGEWLLRSAEGFTGRANSALPVGDPGMDIEAALDRVVEFYRSLGRPPQIDVPLPLAEPVRDAAVRRGWECVSHVRVLVADVAAVRERAGTAPQVALLDTPSPDHLEQIAQARGAFPPAARHVLTAVPRLVFAEIRDPDGALIARARGTVTDGWLGVFTVATAPAARRTGLATGGMGALCGWASGVGAAHAYLQVADGNTAAQALYERLGFIENHTYFRYRARY